MPDLHSITFRQKRTCCMFNRKRQADVSNKLELRRVERRSSAQLWTHATSLKMASVIA
jgi:hypothetical protein